MDGFICSKEPVPPLGSWAWLNEWELHQWRSWVQKHIGLAEMFLSNCSHWALSWLMCLQQYLLARKGII